MTSVNHNVYVVLAIFCYISMNLIPRAYNVSGIGAVVKVVDSHLCGWGSIPGKSCSFLIVSFSKGLSLCFMCSDQHVKYRMPRGFPSTNSLLLNYHVKQYVLAQTHTRSLNTTSYMFVIRWFLVSGGITESIVVN